MGVVPNAPKRASALGERPGQLKLYLDTLICAKSHVCKCVLQEGLRPTSGSVLFCYISDQENTIFTPIAILFVLRFSFGTDEMSTVLQVLHRTEFPSFIFFVMGACNPGLRT